MNIRLNKKSTSFLLHLLTWLIVWFVISLWASEGNKTGEYLLKNVSIILPMICIVYINWFWLFPKYFVTKRYWLYGLLGILLLYLVFYVGEMFIVEWMDLLYPNRPKKKFDFDVYALPTSFWRIMNGAAPYTLSVLSSTIFLAVRQKHKGEKETARLRLENAHNKIKYLQSQISPHFLFNALNNVHSLILQDKEKAADYVIKLSDLLRFTVYESDKDFITLGEEIKLIEKYTTLVDFRIGSKRVSDNSVINIQNKDLKIPPLLVFGILENGIKHSGMGIENDFELNIVIEERQGVLSVEMNNSISLQKFDSKKKGFGIESLKKRLDLYYPNGYTFTFNKLGNKATTLLNVNLNIGD